MFQHITTNTSAREHVATITSKGQITIPASVRKHLKTNTHRKLAFVVKPNGTVQVKAPKYPTLESLAGSVPSPAKPITIKAIRKIVEEEIVQRYIAKEGK